MFLLWSTVHSPGSLRRNDIEAQTLTDLLCNGPDIGSGQIKEEPDLQSALSPDSLILMILSNPSVFATRKGHCDIEFSLGERATASYPAKKPGRVPAG